MYALVLIALATSLAFLAESLVEYLLGTLVDHVPSLGKFRWALMYVSALVGIGLAFWYNVDLIALILAQEPTTIGVVLSGLIIGRGANYLHQFVSKYLKKPA